MTLLARRANVLHRASRNLFYGANGMKWFLLAATIALIVLHQDFWNWNKVDAAFGFLPVGLWYHALYCVAASILLWLFVGFAWPAQLDAAEREMVGKETGANELR